MPNFTGYGQGGFGQGGFGGGTSIDYYISLLTSQYQKCDKLKAWLTACCTVVEDALACLATFDSFFDLDMAAGVRLDIIGKWVGVSRQLNFQPSGGVSSVLTDSLYRTIIRAKIAKNTWNGSTSSLQALWQTLFPGGRIAILDNQNMTVTVILSGNFSATIQELIMNDYIVPRPEGVLMNYVFPVLPILGFDRNDSFVAGLDTGHFI